MSFVVFHSDERGRVIRGKDAFGPRSTVHRLAVALRKSETSSEEPLRSRRSEANDDFRSDKRNLALQPAAARVNFERVGLGVEASFAARPRLEVLDHVREVDAASWDFGLLESVVEEGAYWSNKRTTHDVLLFPGLLSNEHESSGDGACSEHELRGALVQVAPVTLTGDTDELVVLLRTRCFVG